MGSQHKLMNGNGKTLLFDHTDTATTDITITSTDLSKISGLGTSSLTSTQIKAGIENIAGLQSSDSEIDAQILYVGNVQNYGDIYAGGDTTSIFQSCLDTLKSNGGGTMRVPKGIFSITSLKILWDLSAIPISIIGNGINSTKFIKFGNSTSPLFDFEATVNIMETYSSFEGFSIYGTDKLHDGVKLTKIARFDMNKVQIKNCNTAIINYGGLVGELNKCSLQGNINGYVSNKSDSIYPNLITINHGNISSNSNIGLEFIYGNGCCINGTDISANGTSGNITTGGIFIRNTTSVEIGLSSFSSNNVWMELNKGTSFKIEDSSNLMVENSNLKIVGAENGVSYMCGIIKSNILTNPFMVSTSDTATINATNSIISGGFIANIADRSTNYTHIGVGTSSGSIPYRSNRIDVVGESGQELKITSDVIAGGVSKDITFQKLGDGKVRFRFGASVPLIMNSTGIAFFGSSPTAKRTIVGSRSDPEGALKNLITNLVGYGLIVDSSTI